MVLWDCIEYSFLLFILHIMSVTASAMSMCCVYVCVCLCMYACMCRCMSVCVAYACTCVACMYVCCVRARV